MDRLTLGEGAIKNIRKNEKVTKFGPWQTHREATKHKQGVGGKGNLKQGEEPREK